MKPEPEAALLVVDVQHGFISQADELPVPDAASIIPVINGLMQLFPLCVATQDWHPKGHGSFASSHPGSRPFQEGMLGGLPQIYWPDHCVQGTRGAALHQDLDQRPLQAIFRKGTDPGVDSYSAFADNRQERITGLDAYLKARGVRHLYVCGLALDYCVRWSALDARRLLPECQVTVITDATRPVEPESAGAVLAELRRAGVLLTTASVLAR